MTASIEYFRPSVTVDVLVLRWRVSRLELLLIQRANPPFKGAWALPGGFIEEAESLEASARRELAEETGLKVEQLSFFGVYGEPGRDPRGRTITLAYYSMVPLEQSQVSGQDDALQAQWFALEHLPDLAFDHAQIVQDGLANLEARLAHRYPESVALAPEIIAQHWHPPLRAWLNSAAATQT